MIEEIKRTFQLINQFSEPVYVVGGFLRELYFGKISHDLDFIVMEDAHVLAKFMARKLRAALISLDHKRDIYRVVTDSGMTIDIARCIGEVLEQDLQARDFTINAIACSVSQVGSMLNKTVLDRDLCLDPCNGFSDLKRGLVRGIQRSNFESDPLRLLRAFRFAAALDFKIEKKTLIWIHELAEHIRTPAAERIQKELDEICKTPRAMNAFQLLKSSGVLAFILPETTDLRLGIALEQIIENLDDYFPQFALVSIQSYLQKTVGGAKAIRSVLKLLSLFMLEDEVNISLICERLRLSNHEAKFMEILRECRIELNDLSMGSAVSPLKMYQLFQTFKKECIGFCLFLLALAKVQGTNCRIIVEEILKRYFEPTDRLAHPLMLLNGQDIMQNLQIKPSPMVGTYLAKIKEAYALGEISNRQEALEWIRKKQRSLTDNFQ